MPFFKVIYPAGAYLDDFHYEQDEIVEYHPNEDEKVLWGVEVDANGDEIENREDKDGENLPNQRIARSVGKNKEATAPRSKTEQRAQIKEALGMLDGNDDSVWTASGDPKVEAVVNVLGYEVTRADIDDASKDFKRPA